MNRKITIVLEENDTHDLTTLDITVDPPISFEERCLHPVENIARKMISVATRHGCRCINRCDICSGFHGGTTPCPARCPHEKVRRMIDLGGRIFEECERCNAVILGVK